MGFIDFIDDRDVINLSGSHSPPAGPESFKDWLMVLKANNPTAKVITLGGGLYQLDLNLITCTGSDVNTRFNIPYMHQLLRVGIKHTDSSKADSTDPLTYSLSKQHHPNLWMLLLGVVDSTASDILDGYNDYYMEAGEYLLVSNTTNTDQLRVNVIIGITGV